MKRVSKQIAIFTALFFLVNCLTGFAANTEKLPEAAATAVTPDTPSTGKTPLSDETPSSDGTLFSKAVPSFHAGIEYSFQGYIIKGSLAETPPDVDIIQTMYSLDGTTYQDCGEPWDFHFMKVNDEGVLEKLQNQICLYPSQEPLKSYLDKNLDRFFLKLRLVLKNGTTYETQAALIDRGEVQPIPKELVPTATFAPSIAAYETRPFCGFGNYQLTVSETSSPEEIVSCLPDMLPVEIQFSKGLQHITAGIVDCPITWKTLSLPTLAAGKSVTVRDAAEKLVVPEGTLVNTPTGMFRLDKPLSLNEQYGLTNEVRLVLNVVSKDEAPTGALKAEHDGLEMAFHQKPTGATDIQAYVWSENNPVWTSLPNAQLLNVVNDQPSTASSGYALVIGCEQEPYRSYLAEKAAGNTPAPFLIGLTIKGGVYDGKQLILAWPDTYEIPLALPKPGGSGGNELNAGAGNENNSTPEGQRPNLPHNPENHSNINETATHDEKSGREQRRTPSYASYKPVSYIWLPLSNISNAPKIFETVMPQKTNKTYVKTTSKTANEAHTKTASDTTNETHTKTAFETKSEMQFAALSETENEDLTNTAKQEPLAVASTLKNHRLLPLTATTAADIIIGTAIAVSIIGGSFYMAGRKSTWILNFLKKFHDKRRALSRR